MSEFLLCCVYNLIGDDTTEVVLIHYSLSFRKEIYVHKTVNTSFFFLHSMLITWVTPLREGILDEQLAVLS